MSGVPPLIVGVGWIDHRFPFQRSASIVASPLASM
jgi:hypothetical protein